MRYTYRFQNGDKVTTNLKAKEMLKRMNRLDTLRVLTEQHECEEGRSICKKALKAYNKLDGFTGIIRLTFSEKDWLGYMLEDNFLDDEDRECIEYYTK
jgi:hypothetical protein